MKYKPQQFYLYDDGYFDYRGVVEPRSLNEIIGYTATAWNTGLQHTGWWQGRNVIGISTTDPLFSHGKGGNVNDVSQAVQIQQTFNKPLHPWIWEADQGHSDIIGMKAKVAQPISWGTNHQASNFLLRLEDTSAFNSDWGHGQRLWIQVFTFENKYPNRPMEIYMDPYTDGRDIVVNVPLKKGTYEQFFDFSGSADVQSKAYNNLLDFQWHQSRKQYTDLTYKVERDLGIDIQNESGYWKILQTGFTSETASFQVSDWRSKAWDIGDHGAMQTAIMDLQVYDA